MFNYDPLWKTLRDRNLKKKDLLDMTGFAPGTLAKLGKNESVGISVIDRICTALEVDISKVVSCGPPKQEHGYIEVNGIKYKLTPYDE